MERVAFGRPFSHSITFRAIQAPPLFPQGALKDTPSSELMKNGVILVKTSSLSALCCHCRTSPIAAVAARIADIDRMSKQG